MEKNKGFLKRLFPSELAKYIPGQKLVAGAIVFGIGQLAQLAGVDLSVFGISGNDIQGFAVLLAAYAWPDVSTPIIEPRSKR